MATTMQHHQLLQVNSTSPTPSLDSLTGMVLANGSASGLTAGSESASGVGDHSSSESGLTLTSCNTGSGGDRDSTSSASSSGLGFDSGLNHVTTLNGVARKDGGGGSSGIDAQELESIKRVVHEGKNRAQEIRSNLKSLENTSARLSSNYNKAQFEINETFQFYTSLLEERKAEIMRDLDRFYSDKQMALNVYNQKGQDTIDKIHQVTEFIERLLKDSCNNGEAFLFERPIKQKFSALLTGQVSDIFAGLNEEEIVDFEFISNPQAIQTSVKNTFGYVRSRNSSGTNSSGTNSSVGSGGCNGVASSGPPGGSVGGGSSSAGMHQQQNNFHRPCKQPPISRPTSSNSSSQNSVNGGIVLSSFLGGATTGANTLSNGLAQGIATFASNNGDHVQHGGMHNGVGQQPQHQQHSMSNGIKDFLMELEQKQNRSPSSSNTSSGSFLANPTPTSIAAANGGLNGHLNNNVFDHSGAGGLLSKRFNPASSSSASGLVGGPLVNSDFNPYEKWSNGSDKPFDSSNSHNHHHQHHNTTTSFGTTDSILELSSKLLSLGQQQHQQPHPHHQQQQQQQLGLISAVAAASNGVVGGVGAGGGSTSNFPPKSQIKRQKMVYHCKFGEFGVLEGQFTEPSGVAVNAQNDIVVADTNNHRIQIFDKEGRFKFQFGECGKRDGQLLYPNRVAVVRSSGDIIVTERSPTHQVQIYNQYGQFVRKFGANILQHPRGVTVDNKGRIIVVECKVMRVIIFDQSGNVLNKFGCSKHLEFPNGVVVNDRQEIFISDNRAHCVKVFNYEGVYLRQIGGEGITNYPIGVGINASGEVIIADNHNNFNLSVFSQEGQLLAALESKVKHAQCFDVSLMDDGSVVLASKDYRLYIYRYVQVPPMGI